MDRLVSKILAGGLSAGVFLLWWPEHVHGEGLLQLVIRGLLWTLAFELLLLAFSPAELLITRRLRDRITARGVRGRLPAVPAPARTGGVVALACCGLVAPLALLADAPRELVKKVDRPRVVKQVIVKRPVVEKQIIVRKVVAPAAAEAAATRRLQSIGAAPSVPTSQVARPTAGKPTKAPTRRTAPAERTQTTATSTPTAPAAAAKPADTPAPAAETATPQAGTGTPASSAEPSSPAPAPAAP